VAFVLAVFRRTRRSVNALWDRWGFKLLYGGQSLQDVRLQEPNRGSTSLIIIQGKYNYGMQNISLASWGEGAHLYIGSFNSISRDLRVFLGGNHRTEWISPFRLAMYLRLAFLLVQ